MCIKEIIENVQNIKINTNRLRDLSPYYPALYCEYNESRNFITTLIRKTDSYGKWYTVHLLKSFKNLDMADIMIRSVMIEAHNIQYLYIIQPDIDYIDELQITEEERCRNNFKEFIK